MSAWWRPETLDIETIDGRPASKPNQLIGEVRQVAQSTGIASRRVRRHEAIRWRYAPREQSPRDMPEKTTDSSLPDLVAARASAPAVFQALVLASRSVAGFGDRTDLLAGPPRTIRRHYFTPALNTARECVAGRSRYY